MLLLLDECELLDDVRVEKVVMDGDSVSGSDGSPTAGVEVLATVTVT